jgi:hypothetical protein
MKPMRLLVTEAAAQPPRHVWSRLIFNVRQKMKTTTQNILFGTFAGMLWSLVPGTLSELFTSFGQGVSVILCGALTGMIVTFTVRRLLDGNSKGFGIFVGVLSLPYGAFLFGLIISFAHALIAAIGGPKYRFIEYRFEPFEARLSYALYSSISIFAIVLFPAAIFTTLRVQKLNQNKK